MAIPTTRWIGLGFLKANTRTTAPKRQEKNRAKTIVGTRDRTVWIGNGPRERHFDGGVPGTRPYATSLMEILSRALSTYLVVVVGLRRPVDVSLVVFDHVVQLVHVSAHFSHNLLNCCNATPGDVLLRRLCRKVFVPFGERRCGGTCELRQRATAETHLSGRENTTYALGRPRRAADEKREKIKSRCRTWTVPGESTRLTDRRRTHQE